MLQALNIKGIPPDFADGEQANIGDISTQIGLGRRSGRADRVRASLHCEWFRGQADASQTDAALVGPEGSCSFADVSADVPQTHRDCLISATSASIDAVLQDFAAGVCRPHAFALPTYR